MNNRTYRVVCLLNVLAKRLRVMQRANASPPEVLRLLESEAAYISAFTTNADKRYLRDRLRYMLDAHYEGIDLDGAHLLIKAAVESGDMAATRHAAAASFTVHENARPDEDQGTASNPYRAGIG